MFIPFWYILLWLFGFVSSSLLLKRVNIGKNLGSTIKHGRMICLDFFSRSNSSNVFFFAWLKSIPKRGRVWCTSYVNAPKPRMLTPIYLQNCSFIYSHAALQITKSWDFGSRGLNEGDVLSHGYWCFPGNRDLFFRILYMNYLIEYI